MHSEVSLLSLPDELIIMVMQRCELTSLQYFSQTCRHYNCVKNDNDIIWASQVWRTGALEDVDNPDLKAAIAAQYSTLNYYDDCTTWKRLFMKIYLTDRNWRQSRYRQTSLKLEGNNYEE